MTERSAGSEYEQSLMIAAPPEAIFDFVADVSNLPKYLPTTKSAQSQGPERVQVQGQAGDRQYNSDGFLRADRDNMRLEWGADEGYYSGFLTVDPQGAQANVTVHISLRGTPPGADPNERPPDHLINDGLRKGLESIQNYVTGTGGKEKSVVEP